MIQTLTEQLNNTPEGQRLYQQEYAIQQITDLICELMNHKAITRSELALRLGKTKGYITQMLDGRTNMTVRTMADVMTALDHSVRFEADSLGASPHYAYAFDLHSNYGAHWQKEPRFTGVPTIPEKLVA